MREGGGEAAIWLLLYFAAWACDATQAMPVAEFDSLDTDGFRDDKGQRFSDLEESGMLQDLLESITSRFESSLTSPRYKRQADTNHPPSFVKPLKIQVRIGETVETRLLAVDPEGDEVTISLASPSAIGSVTADGTFTTYNPISGSIGDVLSSLLSIQFKADYQSGGTDYLSPEWEICACENGADCDFDTRVTSAGRLHVSGCKCSEAYDGTMCQNDRDNCLSENSCFEGVKCFDYLAPLHGYWCGECPDGYRGDGVTCLENSPEPVLENGGVWIDGFEDFMRIEFECDIGYWLIGADVIICHDFDFDAPTCEDVNECAYNPCHQQASCQNIAGSFLCICNEGFIGDGIDTCKPLLHIEYFSCRKIDSNSIQVNWQIRPKDSSSVDQIIVTWSEADNFTYETQEGLNDYNNEFENYEDKVNSIHSDDFSLEYQILGKDHTSYVATGLKPDTFYLLRLRLTISDGLVENPIRMCWKSTGSELPHPAENFKVVQKGGDYLSLSWERPKVTNGPILGYAIEYRQVSPCVGTECFEKMNKEVPGNVFETMISQLNSTESYELTIATVNTEGISEYSSPITVQTTGTKSIHDVLRLDDEMPNDNIPAICFTVKFILHISWPEHPAQHRLLELNLKNMIQSSLSESGSLYVKNLIISEVDDHTSVYAQIWFANTSNFEYSLYSFWKIKRLIIQNSIADPWMQNLVHASVNVSECERQSDDQQQFLKNTDDIFPNYVTCSKVKYDIVFLLDRSHSLSDESFDSIKRTIIDFVKEFDIGPYDTQVGLALYSHDSKVAFHLNEYKSKQQLINAINSLVSNGFGTNAGIALQRMLYDMLIESRGRRSINELHIVVVTDGKSSDDVSEESRNLHLVTPHVNVIGIGDRVEVNELNTIAGNHGRVILYPDTTALSQNMVLALGDSICPSYGCNYNMDYVDLIFVLDSTSSTNKETFQKMRDLTAIFISKLETGKRNTSVGIAIASNEVESAFSLNQYHKKEDILSEVQAISHRESNAGFDSGKVLQYINDKMVSTKAGRRPGAGLAIVFLISKNTGVEYESIMESFRRHEASIIVLSLSKRTSNTDLKIIVSSYGALFDINTKDLKSRDLEGRVMEEVQKSASCAGIFVEVRLGSSPLSFPAVAETAKEKPRKRPEERNHSQGMERTSRKGRGFNKIKLRNEL